ncbi:hypothetical protein [Actinophytocola xanthii]|uniref:Condensation domain-containing protein n=1 Tax=Actinophytocola xanthii TaxID=1912961 RepID=A0A1Q8BQL4_9PSEU|nr:hypothetical protein [Actinophytocola xanthii]OLF04403.1 hypothetical protein BU204_37745 [Actinophytocola xanthii]
MILRTVDAVHVPAVLRGQGDIPSREAALCAVAVAVARWNGFGGAYVMMEGTGEATEFSDVDRSLAVGWFTSMHPVAIEVDDPTATLADSLPRLLEQIRRRPNDGVGYGVLRHLAPSSPGSPSSVRCPSPASSSTTWPPTCRRCGSAPRTSGLGSVLKARG